MRVVIRLLLTSCLDSCTMLLGNCWGTSEAMQSRRCEQIVTPGSWHLMLLIQERCMLEPGLAFCFVLNKSIQHFSAWPLSMWYQLCIQVDGEWIYCNLCHPEPCEVGELPVPIQRPMAALTLCCISTWIFTRTATVRSSSPKVGEWRAVILPLGLSIYHWFGFPEADNLRFIYFIVF